MSERQSGPVLVVGGTGKQGGAAARALLAAGTPVRALVRQPGSDRAEALRAAGAELVQGDLNDVASLTAAATGASAVYSVQMPDMADLGSDSEQVQGRNMVEAAAAAAVPHFIQASVSGAGDWHRSVPGWDAGRWAGHMEHYWESKARTDVLVRAAGFAHWTILKPATFMENFKRPSFMFANWVEDRFLTALTPQTRLALIAVDDIGAAVAAAVAEPARFHGLDLDLAGDVLSMTDVARILSDVWGVHVEPPSLTVAEALEQGLMPELVDSQEWMNEVGSSPARPEAARALGLSPVDFATWAASNLRPVAGASA